MDAGELHTEVDGRGPRVVLVHGFTQTLASWEPVAALLTGDHEVVRVDLPGHGGSSSLDADLTATARHLADAGGPATYVGYSMGGRVALRLALDRPEVVDGLVLIGATAGIDDPAERAARRSADEELAARIEADGVEAFLDRWLAQPLFDGLAPTEEDLAGRRANTATGLATSLRLAGTATMDPPWWDDLHRIDVPVLAVAGERDAKFRALAERIAGAIGPNGRTSLVAGAGHAAHLERPDAVAALVRSLTGRSTAPP